MRHIYPAIGAQRHGCADRGERMPRVRRPDAHQHPRNRAGCPPSARKPSAFRRFVCRPQDSPTPSLHRLPASWAVVESGSPLGDAVMVLPNGLSSRVKAIEIMARRSISIHEQSVTLLLEDEIDTLNGDI